MVSSLARTLLYIAAAASSTTALGHTKMGYDLVFPALKKLGVQDKGAISARIGWLEVNQGFVIFSIFCLKWAQFGITDVYDKAFAGVYCACQFYFGWCYLKAGIKEPVIPLWGIPTLVGVSQLL
ncbi:hypothetical protein BKA64DRAFT_653070 [Cadophora sp. MPI-SDFR-AT-0126]|nr:hypothetical protein BKA64DRAFT_653070 [Leotiomycetes sp. MPI-SDFR-AT-0126]